MKQYTGFFTFLILQFLLFSKVSAQDFFGQIAFPDGQNGQVIAVDLNNNVYIGVWGKGIMKSTDNGNSFILRNNGLTNFLIKDIYVTQNGTIFVATMGGGIFRSTDGANTWSAVNNGLKTLHITALKEFSTGIIIAGSYGYGVFYSTNNGTNWQQSSIGLNWRAITSLETTKNGYILAGTYGGGIYQSRDTLKTWRRSSSGLGNLFIHKLTKNTAGNIFAATNGKGVYMSPNDGISWGMLDTTGIEDMNVTCIVISGSNEEIIGTRNGGIQYYDKDLYQMWRTPFQPLMGVTSFARASNNRIYAVGTNESVYVSTNNGRNWTPLGKYKDGELFLAYAPSVSVVMAQFNKQKTYFSTNYGNNWSVTNLPQFQLNGVVKNNLNRYFAATNGLYYSDDGINWTKVNRFGDTIITSIDFNNGILLLSILHQDPPSGQNPPPPPIVRMYASFDGGNTFNQFTYPSSQAHCRKLRIALNGNIYAMLGSSIYRKTIAEPNWTQLNFSGFSNLIIQDFDIDNSSFVYVSTNKGVLYSQDNGSTWTFKKFNYKSQDSLNVPLIFASPNGTIYALGAFARDLFTANGIWRSTNNGFNWDSINTNVTSNPSIQLAIDPDNNVYMASNALYRRYNPLLMLPPTIVFPANNAKGLMLNPELKWNSAAKAELYELQISEADNFEYLHEFVIQADTSYVVEKSLEFNKTYYWRIRSKTDGSYSNWSNTYAFSTKLNAPLLVYPSNNSTGVSLTPTFIWQKVPNATIYELKVSNKPDFSTIFFAADSLKDTTLKSIPLKADETYYWQVRAKSDFSISDWSETWTFKTTFGAPLMIYPPKDTINIPITLEFKWGKVDNSTYYKIRYSKNQNMSDSIEIQTTDNQILVENLDYDTKYYWQVKTGNNQGESDYSQIWSFTTMIKPVKLTSPTNQSNNIALSPELKWEQLNNYDKYQIQLSTDEKFEKIVIDTIVSKQTNYKTKELEGFTEYFWRIRVNITPKLGYWSEVFQFRTVISRPNLRFPDNHSKNNPTSIQFLWFPRDGAKYYFLQIARDKNFNDLIISKDSIQSTSYQVDGLEFSKEYFWRVRASNDFGFSDWSEVWDFQTTNIRPVLLRPANNSLNISNPVILEWRAIEGATQYFVQIAKDENFNNLVISQENVPTNTYTFEGEYNNTYYWRVKVKIGDYTSDWSDIWTFSMQTKSVAEPINDKTITIYPNPASNYLQITTIDKSFIINKITLTNISGLEMLKFEPQNNNSLQINLEGMPSGIYILKIYNLDKVYYKLINVVK